MRAVVVSAYPRRAGHLTRCLRAHGHQPVAVLTPRRPQPSRGGAAARGRRSPRAAFPPDLDVVELRDKRSIPALLRAYVPDVVVCWGFPWLVPPAALSVPPHGWLNLHPSALPRHRGPTPLPWALRAGDPVIGVTWHLMDSGLDTGHIFAQSQVPAGELDASDPWRTLIPLAKDLLPLALKRLAAGDPGDPQPEDEATYEGRFNFDEFTRIGPELTVREITGLVAAWRLAKKTGPFRGPVLELDGEDHRIVAVSPSQPSGQHRSIAASDGTLWITESVPLGCRLRAKGAPAGAGEQRPRYPRDR